MKTPKELVDKFIKSFGDNEIPIDEMYYNKSESTGINMRSFLEDFAEDISEQTKELQEQLAASNSFLDKRCSENNELSVTIHKLEEQLAAKEREWISVEDRLPELEDSIYVLTEDVIVILEDGDRVITYYDYKIDDWILKPHSKKVTYWMPLPTPPSW